ncbi:MAG: beta-ketoacyl synthase N-terminal-like domain-containing protein, partial [Planctomycetota bacterium]
MPDDIVITGMGILSPIGCGEKPFWESLCTGRSGAAPVEGLDTSELSRKVACQVRDPVPVDRSMGRASQLAVAAAREAVTAAGLSLTCVAAPRVSIIVGTTMGETEFIEERLGAPSEKWLSADHAK